MKECFVEQLFEGNHILAIWFTREIILYDKVPFYSNKKNRSTVFMLYRQCKEMRTSKSLQEVLNFAI
ncbi:hypothetical protein T01_635 [Trichinella spiralis]|uniref:Uncharacterized protein n=1 Tax=Trichinella spiralis TaxID=6334 RepID=A0A0V1BJQ6_TRISP|nr:hypothetical protein T01_635 [Trichinella spiralis]